MPCRSSNLCFYFHLALTLPPQGLLELVVSLTDRVVRTYRWLPALPSPPAHREEGGGSSAEGGSSEEELASLLPGSPGRLVSVNKWEFASQIGTVTANTDR